VHTASQHLWVGSIMARTRRGGRWTAWRGRRIIAGVDIASDSRLACRAAHDEVLLAEPFLIAIVERLRDGRPIWPVGIARVRATLTDGASLLYVQSAPGDLRRWAQRVLDELDDGFA
jgi:hypothetical protein